MDTPLVTLLLWVLVLTSCQTTPDDWVRGCPPLMTRVSAKNVDICVDRFEFSASLDSEWAPKKPMFGLNYYECALLCASRGKRLLTHVEWVTACEGTNPNHCNRFRDHPVLKRVKSAAPWVYQGRNCKDERFTWRTCLEDPSLNQGEDTLAANRDFSSCISKHGVHHMIGNLGEWVSDQRMKSGELFGQFNGGLYPQIRSSCEYKTIAHGPMYKDYSIGCRCALSTNEK